MSAGPIRARAGYLLPLYIPPNSWAVIEMPTKDLAGPMTARLPSGSTPNRIERLSRPFRVFGGVPGAEDYRDRWTELTATRRTYAAAERIALRFAYFTAPMSGSSPKSSLTLNPSLIPPPGRSAPSR